MNIRYERQLKRGVLEIVVLKLISQGRTYGYELISRLDQESGGCSSSKRVPYTQSYTVWRMIP